jgi:taurine dehydrogenase small subunit
MDASQRHLEGQNMTEQETLALIDEISAAFAAHDIDAMVSYFAADGEFVNAVGSDYFGTRYTGADEIRGYFEKLFATAADVQWHKSDIRVAGDKAYAEWRRLATLADGAKQDWQGVDIYSFKNGKIQKKDTYIKVVS